MSKYVKYALLFKSVYPLVIIGRQSPCVAHIVVAHLYIYGSSRRLLSRPVLSELPLYLEGRPCFLLSALLAFFEGEFL